jgi:hypothetical protein
MFNQRTPLLVRKRSVAGSLLLVLFALTFGMAALAAQKKAAPGSVLVSDKGKLNILLDGKSVGHEEFEISPTGSGWIAKGATSLTPPQGASSNVTGSLTLQPSGAPIAYDWSAQTEKTNGAHVVFINGVAKMTLQMQGAHSFEQDLTFDSPAIVVLDNNLYHQYAVLARVYDWSRRGKQDFSVLIPQELTPGTLSVESLGSASIEGKPYETLKVQTSDLELTLYLDSTHRLMRIEVPSAKVSVVRE